MTGAMICGTLLLADQLTLAAVAAANIKLGALPEGVALPALLVRTVSSVEFQPLRRPAVVRTTDRVSVTVRAASYRQQVAIIGLVRSALAGRTGNLANALRVSIVAAGTGPDVLGPANSFEQSLDFRVSFDVPA